ncbi:uncharacterized protein LOC115324453 [Ixodes scapularis]|uniref:uncharacterized protein LOC115324453 n=1 Tax=Ixodes scapularis TaxID=6945 RepID=UPI001C38F13E|nr:uncharacterized protein LOC115324453 [Ixodes scapularis]
MESVACTDYLIVRRILECVPVSDLFCTSEVSRLWQAISISLLKKKLRYLCYCHIKSEEKCPTTASGQPKFLEDFCRDLRRFIRIARLAQCSPTFGFLSYSSNPKDEKAVVQQVQRQLSPSCVVVYHRSKTITMRARDDPTQACSVYRGITGAFLFGRRTEGPASPASAGPVAPASRLPEYRRRSSFRRSRLEKLSKLFQRAVLRRPADDPCLRNVAPGVMLFHSFRIPMEDGRCLTTHWKERSTGRIVAVSFMRLFQQRDAARARQLLSNFRRGFSPSCSSPQDTFVIVLQNSMEDTRELRALVELFPQVPVMSISGEFLKGEDLLLAEEPLASRKVIVMVLSLLAPGAEAHVILDDEIE